MYSLLDDVVVGAVLMASGLYALGSLGPRSLKRRLLSILAAILRLAPKLPGLYRAALRLEAAAAAPVAGSCGGCDNCGSAAPLGSSAGSSAASSVGSSVGASDGLSARQAPAPEIRIPVSKIGRR